MRIWCAWDPSFVARAKETMVFHRVGDWRIDALVISHRSLKRPIHLHTLKRWLKTALFDRIPITEMNG